MAILPSTPSSTPLPSGPKRAPAPFGLLVLFLLAAPVAFAACTDDGNILGSEGNAGMPSGGASAGNATAGSAHAGTMTSAGAAGSTHTGGANSMGGTNSTGGTGGTHSAGAGGGTTCPGECFRANVCLDKCGGNVVYTGCCECGALTVEELSCGNSGGQGSGGATSSDCVGMTCAANQTCVAYRTVGGAITSPDTAGNCPTGKHVENHLCQSDFAYTCAELAGCTAPAPTCGCAANTKCANDHACSLPTSVAWLDTSADLVCEQQVP